MAFGGTGSQFSFGSNNKTNTGAGFGGFGNNTSNNTGFGSSTTNTGGFGNTSTSNPFGGGSTFGSNTGGGFGSNNNSSSLFGAAKSTPFGTSNTSTGLFGSNTNTNTTSSGGFGGGGGFGSGNNPSAFGSNTTGSSPFTFGASKPAFGSGGGSTLFGSGTTSAATGFGGASAFGGAGSGTALSATGVPPCEGTAVTPFAPTNEKEQANSSQMSAFQSINVMPAYSKYSFEELRLADYNAGRRFGNGSGQAGGFGTGTFGGFGSGSTTGSGFGGASSTTTPFGGSGSTTGFGGNLFGGAKSTPSLFGTQSSATSSGGIFGTAPGTSTGGFGSTGGGFGASTGPFGSKPSGGFGATTTGNSFNFGGTGAANTTTGTNSSNLFGSTPSIFGTQPAQQSTTNLFGGNPSAQKSIFGGNTGFGTSTTQGQQSGNIFGGATNPTPSLFGTNNSTTQQAPSLFGSNPSATNFGTSNQPKTLFGAAQPANTSIFGGGSTNPTPNSFGTNFTIGGSTAQKPAPLFGGAGQTNTSPFGTSNTGLFNSTQNTQQQQDGPKHASLLDGNPYGQSSIWTGLPTATPQNSGPLLTPLTAHQRLKESQTKPPPSIRLSPARYMTPRRTQGYGFSYSTYGSPASAASTPGTGSLNNSMYGRSFTGGSFGRTVGKSFSASNLRSQFAADGESVLSPGAFAPGSARYSGGSIRRLTIDRSIKADLFRRPDLPALPPATTPTTSAPPFSALGSTNGLTAESANGSINGLATNMTNGANGITPEPVEKSSEPGKLKKRVSFDKDITGGDQNGDGNVMSGALVRTESEEDNTRVMKQGNSRPRPNGPEMQQLRGNELAVVPEDRESDAVSKPPTKATAQKDPTPGEYWMKPSRQQISKMTREQKSSVVGFQVGRVGCGFVTFDKAVDLNSIKLDDLYDKIVEIRVRSITVYPEASTKPPVGRGLNVPSTIRIDNSWPRSRGQPSSLTSGPVFEKHVRRLKEIPGTQFIDYSAENGTWTFRVPHYTRYALDYDDDEEESEMPLSVEQTPQTRSKEESGENPEERSEGRFREQSAMDLDNADESDAEDDTFAFKLSGKIVPGGFGQRSAIDDEEMDEDDGNGREDSDCSEVSQEEVSDEEVDMAGSFPQPGGVHDTPPPLLKPSQPWDTPGRPLLDLDGDWADQLQRTISPRKQNREALREVQSKVLLDRAYEPMKPKKAAKVEFRTSIDLMNSLFGEHQERMSTLSRKQDTAGSDFEFPYSKRAKVFNSDTRKMPEIDQTWHASFKPSWTATGQLISNQSKMTHSTQPWGWSDQVLVAGEGYNIAISSLVGDGIDPTTQLQSIWPHIKVAKENGVPSVTHESLPFSTFGRMKSSNEEAELYELAHILFDEYDDEFTAGLSAQNKKMYDSRVRKDRLTNFLGAKIWKEHLDQIRETRIPEETAILHLTANNVTGACNALMSAKDYNLSLLVAQINQADESFQEDIERQIADWRQQNTLSEISEPVRALYEILAGNTSFSEGKRTGPIEDQTSNFIISEQFGLDWLQAFGLCFWYGKHKNGTIEDVVQECLAKLEQATFPQPTATNGRGESALWVLLKLYSSERGGIAQDLPQSLDSLSQPFDSRAAFQLHHALATRLTKVRVDHERADQLASDFASQLSATGSILSALYALLHLTDVSKRESAIKSLLVSHAASLPDPSQSSSVSLWQIITEGLMISQQWIYRAKALYARSQQETLAEIEYLLLAEEWTQAHHTLCRRVAPRAVIDEDWTGLADVLRKFGERPEEKVADWASGGAIYADVVSLVLKKSSKARLQNLQTSLSAMGHRLERRGKDLNVGGTEELEERVACKEMSRLLADLLATDGSWDKSVLDLPLTADVRMVQTRNLGVDSYRVAMASR